MELSEEAGNRFSERLSGMVDDLLTSSGLVPADIQGVAVSSGPGSFTGLRVGVSYAKGIAHALGIPFAGVPVFEAMAVRLSERRISGMPRRAV